MRFPAVVVPTILLLAGAVYFFARAKENPGRWADRSPFDQPAPAPAKDSVDDECDRALVRTLLETPELNQTQANTLLSAAGRRYMRRKLAYAEARQAVDAGRAPARRARSLTSTNGGCPQGLRCGRIAGPAQPGIDRHRPGRLGIGEAAGLYPLHHGGADRALRRPQRLRRRRSDGDGAGLPPAFRQAVAGEYARRKRRPPRHGLRPYRTLRRGRQPVAARRRVGAALPRRKTRYLPGFPRCRAGNGHRGAHPHRSAQQPSGARKLAEDRKGSCWNCSWNCSRSRHGIATSGTLRAVPFDNAQWEVRMPVRNGPLAPMRINATQIR